MSCARDQRKRGELLDQGAHIVLIVFPLFLSHLCSCWQVQPSELEKFHATYGTLLKTSMSTLRKRDKKREKQRAEEAARRKRRLAENIVVQGPKRGNGRRKRQRLIKAVLRQNEARKRVQEREATRAGK